MQILLGKGTHFGRHGSRSLNCSQWREKCAVGRATVVALMWDIPGTGDRLSTPHTLADYIVTLTTAVVTETDTLTRTNYITVSAGGCVSPTAGFSGTPLTGTAPLTVSFTDASSGTISGRWWSFGDGGSSSETDPSHGYTQTGVYTVSLTVSGACGSDVLTRTSYITVSAGGCVSPTAGFSGSPLTGTAPLTVSFSDASSGTISGRWWSFGDGGSSSETNPGHGYTQTGVYTVSLTVSGACGSDVLTRTNYITVSGGYTATTTTITYTYDLLNRLTNAAYSDGKGFTYAYDAAGNRTAYTETITQTLVTTYTYDAANRLTAVGNVSYTYDDRGNLTHDGVYTYTWNAAGRMVKAQSITHTLVYTYNGDDVRVASATDGTETRYVQDIVGLPQVLVETTGGQATLYVYGVIRLAQGQGNATEWFLGDALGSVRQLVDDDGAVVLARDYDPYGQVLSERGTGSSGYGFTGEQYDRYTEFIFLRARWLDAESGRFLSVDPWQRDVQRPQTLNLFVYVVNDPINYIDPTGERFCEDPDHCDRPCLSSNGCFYGTPRFDPGNRGRGQPTWRRYNLWGDEDLLDYRGLRVGAFDRLPVPRDKVTYFNGFGKTQFASEHRCDIYRYTSGWHNGIDFGVPYGTDLYWPGVGPGVVASIDNARIAVRAGPHNIVIQFRSYYVIFGHTYWESDPLRVKEKQIVNPGQRIGRSGDSETNGEKTGDPHLHFEMRPVGQLTTAVNPASFFSFSLLALFRPGPYEPNEGLYSLCSYTMESICKPGQ